MGVDGPLHEAIRRRYIELRYKLLPYIYTNLEESSRSGIPLMRPMFLEFPAEESLQLVETYFTFRNRPAELYRRWTKRSGF